MDNPVLRLDDLEWAFKDAGIKGLSDAEAQSWLEVQSWLSDHTPRNRFISMATVRSDIQTLRAQGKLVVSSMKRKSLDVFVHTNFQSKSLLDFA